MKTVPIVFSFDDNLLLPAGVCFSSLLTHAKEDTFYDIFILHSDKCEYPKSGFLEKLFDRYSNFKLTYRSVGDAFNNAFEIRGITIAAYYRLLIPNLVPEYDIIMYHDVDVIFRSDLSETFSSTDLHNYYIGGVVSAEFLDAKTVEDRNLLGLDSNIYINSGNLMFNSKLLIADNIVPKFLVESKKKYTFQDQDIINIVCKGRIKRMPPEFAGTLGMYQIVARNIVQDVYSSEELLRLQEFGVIHYNGSKPWKQYCPNFDIWWEYYRKSVFFDAGWYFEFYESKLDDLDRLPLWKRVKLLARYFISRKPALKN